MTLQRQKTIIKTVCFFVSAFCRFDRFLQKKIQEEHKGEYIIETNILKFELSVGRALDDNTLDTITASIGIPVEADDDAVNEAMNSDELIAYAVGVLYDLAAYMRPQWLDGEDTGMTLEAYFGDSICQTRNGFVTMDKKGYSFDLED